MRPFWAIARSDGRDIVVVSFVKGSWVLVIMIGSQDCRSIRSSVEIRFSCPSLADRVREVHG